jgi:hypothetical protein
MWREAIDDIAGFQNRYPRAPYCGQSLHHWPDPPYQAPGRRDPLLHGSYLADVTLDICPDVVSAPVERVEVTIVQRRVLSLKQQVIQGRDGDASRLQFAQGKGQ